MSRKPAADAPDTWSDSPATTCERDFRVIDGGEQYVLDLKAVPIRFELRHVRYERGELFARLTVRTTLSGARTHSDVLGAPSSFNLSSSSARSTKAKQLADLSRASQIDWLRLLEELCIRVFEHQDQGEPATDLATMPDPGDTSDDTINYQGIILPSRHQSMLFGDGGVMKSFLMLAIAAYLSAAGFRVAIFDWEMFDRDHRRRLRMFCGDGPLPSILHVRCTRPLVHECERLRRLVRHESIDYAFYDSAGFAADKAPETAEAALGYFQAANLIGIGGCHLAHITKTTMNADNDKKPFGSAFWHNSARCTWNIKLESDEGGERGRRKVLGLFNRKASLDDPYKPVGLSVTFHNGRVTFAPTDLRDTTTLVTGLRLEDRMIAVLKHQPLTLAALAEQTGHANVESLDRTIRRSKGTFTKVQGFEDGITRISLVERRES